MKRVFFYLLLMYISFFAKSQTYHALMGSKYAGSLGMYQNPASTLSSADSTDFALSSFYFNTHTNFIDFGYAPLLGKNPLITLQPSLGDARRIFTTNLNLNLFSFKHKVNGKTAIGAGMNIRSFINANSSQYNMPTAPIYVIDLLQQNSHILPFYFVATSANWLEYVGNISHNLIDNRKYLINIGSNLRINRGLASLFGAVGNFQYRNINKQGLDAIEITNIDLLYGGSSTFTAWDNALGFKENYRNFKGEMKSGASIDVGAEILIKKNKESDWFYEGFDYNYSWKIGLSLVDLGYSQYKFLPESAQSVGIKQTITAEMFLDKLLDPDSSLADFSDYISSVADNFVQLKGNFKMHHPTRLNLNIDHKITPFFYTNVFISLPVSFSNRNSPFQLKEIPLLCMTPRIEYRNIGIYIPVSYNTKTTVHVGAAIRAGPLMLGLNNLKIFNNNKDFQNGGGYISFLFRWKKYDKKPDYNFLKSPLSISKRRFQTHQFYSGIGNF